MSERNRTLITIDISDESILWMCDECNIRNINIIQYRKQAIEEMRFHRTLVHGTTNSWRMKSTRNNSHDYRH